MTTIYTDADLLAVYRQRKSIFYVFLGVTCFYALFCMAWLIYYMSLPYASPLSSLPKIIVSVSTVAYVAFLFPFMGIKYSRVNRYYKALIAFSSGLKNVETNYFYRFEEHSLQKDNIDVTYCLFETWNKKKQEWLERIAYFDPEKPLPNFGSGDHIRYIVQSNFILQYEILERGVYEFEEMEEEEEFQQETEIIENTEETEE